MKARVLWNVWTTAQPPTRTMARGMRVVHWVISVWTQVNICPAFLWLICLAVWLGPLHPVATALGGREGGGAAELVDFPLAVDQVEAERVAQRLGPVRHCRCRSPGPGPNRSRGSL